MRPDGSTLVTNAALREEQSVIFDDSSETDGGGADLCKKLDAKWITSTPASDVERNGFANYSEEALRQGIRNFLEKYADQSMAMFAMGNEPHGTGEKVREKVRAYWANYETVKAFDSDIHVMPPPPLGVCAVQKDKVSFGVLQRIRFL